MTSEPIRTLAADIEAAGADPQSAVRLARHAYELGAEDQRRRDEDEIETLTEQVNQLTTELARLRREGRQPAF